MTDMDCLMTCVILRLHLWTPRTKGSSARGSRSSSDRSRCLRCGSQRANKNSLSEQIIIKISKEQIIKSRKDTHTQIPDLSPV